MCKDQLNVQGRLYYYSWKPFVQAQETKRCNTFIISLVIMIIPGFAKLTTSPSNMWYFSEGLLDTGPTGGKYRASMPESGTPWGKGGVQIKYDAYLRCLVVPCALQIPCHQALIQTHHGHIGCIGPATCLLLLRAKWHSYYKTWKGALAIYPIILAGQVPPAAFWDQFHCNLQCILEICIRILKN